MLQRCYCFNSYYVYGQQGIVDVIAVFIILPVFQEHTFADNLLAIRCCIFMIDNQEK